MKYNTNVQSSVEPQQIEYAMSRVYVRTNITEPTEPATEGEERTVWTYDEVSFTKEEYAQVKGQAVFAEIALMVANEQ